VVALEESLPVSHSLLSVHQRRDNHLKIFAFHCIDESCGAYVRLRLPIHLSQQRGVARKQSVILFAPRPSSLSRTMASNKFVAQIRVRCPLLICSQDVHSNEPNRQMTFAVRVRAPSRDSSRHPLSLCEFSGRLLAHSPVRHLLC
jgi:hypothetical protein